MGRDCACEAEGKGVELNLAGLIPGHWTGLTHGAVLPHRTQAHAQEGANLKTSRHIVHLTGDLLGKKELTACGIQNVSDHIHIVGPHWKHQVTCEDCLAGRLSDFAALKIAEVFDEPSEAGR